MVGGGVGFCGSGKDRVCGLRLAKKNEDGCVGKWKKKGVAWGWESVSR